MTGQSSHVADSELIDLALDCLAEERIGPLLDHLADCEECADRSLAIHRMASVWDNWQEHLQAEQDSPARSWHARLAEALGQLRSQSAVPGTGIAEQLAKLMEAPAALASAAVGILMEPLNKAGNLLTDAASSTGLADPALSFSYVSGHRGGEEDSGPETEQSAFVKTASINDGAQVDVDTAAGTIGVEFLNPEKRYLVLIIPSSSSDPVLAAEAERTPYETMRAEFTNVAARPCVLAVYVLP